MPVRRCRKAALPFVVILLSIIAPQLNGQRRKDPHRPACTSAPCQKIESFVKAHFCGASPFGNGPRNGCDTRSAKQLVSNARIFV
jgi:hypothetical protein